MLDKTQNFVSTVLRRIEAVTKRPYLIGIDGLSGAGKSTFAHNLTEKLPDASVIHKDDFYRVLEEKIRATFDPVQGYYRYFDWERLEAQVLLPLSKGEVAHYQRYDWGKEELLETIEVTPTGIVIVEGVYSTRPELRQYYDLCVWVDTSESERSRRQMDRGENTGEWIGRWAASEKFYAANFQESLSQSLIISGSYLQLEIKSRKSKDTANVPQSDSL
jgi:uridine kinase